MERWLKLTIISGMVSFPQTVATQIEDDHHAHHYCSSNLSVASLQSGAPRCRIVGRRLGRLRRPVSVRLSPQGPSTLGPSLSPRLGERPSTQVDRTDGPGPRLPDPQYASLYWRQPAARSARSPIVRSGSTSDMRLATATRCSLDNCLCPNVGWPTIMPLCATK